MKSWLSPGADYEGILDILEADYYTHYQAAGSEITETMADDCVAGLSVVDAQEWKDGYQDPQWANVEFFADFTRNEWEAS